MRAYDIADEEAAHARDLLKDWSSSGLLTPEQYQLMEQETPCALRRTNIFLRLVLFLFTLIIVCAALALFFEVSFSNPSDQVTGIVLLIAAALSYVALELAVARARLYRYGIEEALAVCSVGFLCVGLQFAFFAESSPSHPAASLVYGAGVLASIWMWRRFGLPYAPLAAIYIVAWLPGNWTSSLPAQHLIVSALYTVGLVAVASIRPRYRLTCLNAAYSATEAFLWIGIYLEINLQLSLHDWIALWSNAPLAAISRPFYWFTWVLIWILPAAILVRGLRQKDRFVIAAGAIAALSTLVTNKLYLGRPHHTWDPVLLGALLIGAALLMRRWLAAGPDGVRHGFTAQRLSDKDKGWMSAAATAWALAPDIAIHNMQGSASDAPFTGDGKSGGAGASSDF